MSSNPKSSTLPANLRLKAQPAEHAAADGGNFFTRLKKRFRLHKGHYDVGVNTGECANVSAVSFKKKTPEDSETDTADFLDADRPVHDRRSESPKSNLPNRSQSERFTLSNIGTKHKSSKFPNLDFNRESPKSKSTRITNLEKHPKKTDNAHLPDPQVGLQGNPYSLIKYDKEPEYKPLEIDKENEIANVCLAADDSAVDLDINNAHSADELACEPGYECISDVKKRIQISKFKSSPVVASTDTVGGVEKTTTDDTGALSDCEPGYEAINDVKKRIIDNDFNSDLHTVKDAESDVGETDRKPPFGSTETSSCHNIYAQSSKRACQSKSLSLQDSVRNNEFIDSALSLSVADTSSTLSCTSGLTASGKSYDSGFDGETQTKVISSQADAAIQIPLGKVAVHFSAETLNVTNADGDDELLLDPNYSECADAIKGFPPYAVSSEGSGSKLSSCTSLNMSVEDFTLESGYAECADAIKTGAIKKISVSHERLADAPSVSEHKSEVYANPQILFRKRSRLLETEQPSSSFLLLKRHSAVDKTNSYDSLCSETSQKSQTDPPEEAPPLPARNYSLYLDNEEAKLEAPSPDTDNGNETDDAFETEVITFSAAGSAADCGQILERDGNAVEKHNGSGGKEYGNAAVDTVNCELQPGTPACVKQKSVGSGRKSIIKCYSETETPDSVHELNTKLKETCMTPPEPDSKVEDMNHRCEAKAGGKSDCCSSVTLTPTSCDTSPGNIAGCEITGLSHRDCCMNQTTESLLGDKQCLNTSKEHDIDTSFQVTVYVNGIEKVLTITEKDESRKVGEKCESAKGSRHRCSVCKCFVCLCYSYSSVANDSVSVECNIKDKLLDLAGQCGCSGNCVRCETGRVQDGGSTCVTVGNSGLSMLPTDRHAVDLEVKCTCNKTEKLAGETCLDNSDLLVQESADRQFVRQQKEDSTTSDSGLCTNMNNMMACHEAGDDLNVNTKAAELYFDNNFVSSLHNTCDELSHATTYQDSDFIDSSQEKVCVVVENAETDVSHVESDFGFGDSDTSSDGFVKTEDLPKLEIDESQWDHSHISMVSCDQCCENEITSQTIETCGRHETKTANAVSENKHDRVAERHGKDDAGCSCTSHLNEPADMAESDTRVNHLCATVKYIDKETVSQGDREYDSSVNSEIKNNHGLSDTDKSVKSDLHKLSKTQTGSDNCECLASQHADTIGEHGDSDNLNTGKHAWNRELPTLTEALPSNLYQDTEPTHMSFRELASLRSEAHAGVEGRQDRLSSRLSDNVFHDSVTQISSSDSCAYQDIPDLNSSLASTVNLSDISIPPPRPPLPTLDQSDHGLSSSSQSTRSSGDTPTDDCFPNGQPFRFSSGGNQSDAADEDTPPVIPPRLKARKQQQAVAAIHRDFMESMKQLKDCGWYWGPLSWEEAEAKLTNKPEGSFLVRDSSDDRYILSLSFRNQERVHHTRIEHHQGHFSFWSQPDSHGKSTIKDFVEQCVDNSRNGRFLYFIRPSGPGSPPLPVHLLHPISRFIQMRSLQHMCRFRIVQLVRRDHIDLLPIPTRIKNYLKEAQYYVEYLDD